MASLAAIRCDQDGEVWTMNFVAANRFLPAAMKRVLQGERSDTATVEMLGPFHTLAVTAVAHPIACV